MGGQVAGARRSRVRSFGLARPASSAFGLREQARAAGLSGARTTAPASARTRAGFIPVGAVSRRAHPHLVPGGDRTWAKDPRDERYHNDWKQISQRRWVLSRGRRAGELCWWSAGHTDVFFLRANLCDLRFRAIAHDRRRWRSPCDRAFALVTARERENRGTITSSDMSRRGRGKQRGTSEIRRMCAIDEWMENIKRNSSFRSWEQLSEFRE